MDKTSFFVIVATIIIFCKTVCLAQTPSNLDIIQLNEQFTKGMLDKKDYLDATDNWINEQFAAGVHFERDTLTNLLSTWKSVAWKADSLSAYRINYYIILSNNANYANREGESVYFLEKAEQEVLATHGEKPLMVAGRKCNTYIDKRNYKNVIATFEKEKAYIKQFPDLIRSKKINLNIAASFINVLNPTINAYANLCDSVKLNETLALAEDIHGALKNQLKPLHNTTFTVNFYMQQLYYYKFFTLENNKYRAREALSAMDHALHSDTTRPASLIGRLQPVLSTRMVEFFLKYKQNDSAAYYLDKLKSIPGVFTDHDFTLNRFEAELLANQGDYRNAYDYAMDAMAHTDSIQSILVNDIDELLYAHTQAEFDRQALQASEKAKRERTIWMIGISAMAIVTIGSIYDVMRRKEKRAQTQIARLNDIANLQISAMEEVRDQAVREEQKRLAMDLHDGLSSLLAGIKHQVELLEINNLQPDMSPKIEAIRSHLDQAYSIARGKSHQWHERAYTTVETSFEKRIRWLLDAALPDDRYTKTVLVDSHTLESVPVSIRIELLRIAQEAITNIIKHAKARTISVVIYNEDEQLFMTISDDGKGVPSDNLTTGIGMRTMNERARLCGGLLSVDSSVNGTNVTVRIAQPLEDHVN